MNSNRKRMVVIGGVAAGTKAAARARRLAPDLDIEIFSDEPYISYAGCAEPYYIGAIIKEKKHLLARTPGYFKKNMNITVRTRCRVTRIDPERQQVFVKNLKSGNEQEVEYDFLVIATGARPALLPVSGSELPEIFTIRAVDDVVRLRELIDGGSVKKAAVVGAGFIGLEMVENLHERGVEVTLIEKLPRMAPTYDEDVALQIAPVLSTKGIQVQLGATVEAFEANANGRLRAVRTDQGAVECDVAILCVGIRPNSEIAREAGIELGVKDSIRTNEHLQTNFSNIFCGGDCAESTHRVTGKPFWQPLGDTANLAGRVIGTNVALAAEGKDPSARFPGVLGTSIFRVFGLNLGQTGLTERTALETGYDIEVAVVPLTDRPHYMPERGSVTVKIVAEQGSGRLLGAQVWGDGTVDKVVDTLATALWLGATAEDLTNLDLAYAPPFSPALGNVIVAAQVLANQLSRDIHGITAAGVRELEREGRDFILLDVRNPDEIDRTPMPIPEKGINIPLPELASRLGELDRDRLVIISCAVGVRATRAYRILKNAGFQKIMNMYGGAKAWPYNSPAS
jgi:NADPH-dependent 2,4-dienoyl-CoA reductase/sulfur reductase-like enzyme/rhodanese-related sulfurtransferase